MRLFIGPTSAGKSTFIQSLRDEAAERGESIAVHFACTLESEIPTGPNDVVHFNLLRGLRFRGQRTSVQVPPELLQLIEKAEHITVISAPRSVLLERVATRAHVEPDEARYAESRYNAERWTKVIGNRCLAQLYELLALHLDSAQTPHEYLCSNTDAHDGLLTLSRWEFPRLAESDAEKLCRGNHVAPTLDLGPRTYQADYREGATGSPRSATLARILQMPLANKRVLDIGCAEGAAALSAARMGARVTGLEPKRSRLKKAGKISEATGVPLKLYNMILDEYDGAAESFDVVLALNVIHHVPDPFAFLDRAAHLTSSHLVLEYPGLDDPKFRTTVPGLPTASEDLPLIGVSLPKADQTYVFTPSSFERYLIDRLGVFTHHEVIESPITNRWLSVFSGKQSESKLDSALAKQVALRQEIAELKRSLADLQNSRSWKVTKPLRNRPRFKR